MDSIINAILGNEKRVAKIKNYKGYVFDKITDYVIGEMASQKIKLTHEEIVRCTVEIANRL